METLIRIKNHNRLLLRKDEIRISFTRIQNQLLFPSYLYLIRMPVSSFEILHLNNTNILNTFSLSNIQCWSKEGEGSLQTRKTLQTSKNIAGVFDQFRNSRLFGYASVYRSSGHVLTAGNPGLNMQITFSAHFAVLLEHRI